MAYDNDTCRIVGTLRRPSGAVMAATAIHLVQDTIRRAWDGAALPVVQTVVSDGNGVVDFRLIPGHYRLVWQDAAGQAEHRLWVPDAPFVWLADAARGHETPWSPMLLFVGGERGVWLDFTQTDTLYQDDAGTVPVTDTDDSIGLIKDLSGNGADMYQSVSTARGQYKDDVVGRVQLDKIDDNYSIDFSGTGGFEATWYQGSKEGLVVGKLMIPDGVWNLADDPRFFPSNNVMGMIIVEGEVSSSMDAAIRQWFADKGCGMDFGAENPHRTAFAYREDLLEIYADHWTPGWAYASTFLRCNNLRLVTGFEQAATARTATLNNFTSAGHISYPVTDWDVSRVNDFNGCRPGGMDATMIDLRGWRHDVGFRANNICRDMAQLETVLVGPETFDARFWWDGRNNPSYANAFTNTNLSEESIDNILVAVERANNHGNGATADYSPQFDQSGGSPPSAVGKAAIDELRNRGWIVNVTGGY